VADGSGGRDASALPQADCLVAAAAVTLRGRLATGNPKDFPMAELQVDFWPVGT
jgi:predicted nucleic acid-binding protein